MICDNCGLDMDKTCNDNEVFICPWCHNIYDSDGSDDQYFDSLFEDVDDNNEFVIL